jgi:hypothetical protein
MVVKLKKRTAKVLVMKDVQILDHNHIRGKIGNELWDCRQVLLVHVYEDTGERVPEGGDE